MERLGEAKLSEGNALTGDAKAQHGAQCLTRQRNSMASLCIEKQRKRPPPRGNAAEANKKGFSVALIIGQKGNYVKFERLSRASRCKSDR